MIIDLQTRAWTSHDQLGAVPAARLRSDDARRAARLDASPTALAAAMDCLQGICLLGFRSERLGAAIPAEFVAEQIRRHPGRIVGVAGIDPLAGDPRDQIDRARELGLSAITLSPSAQGFHPAHSAAMRTYEIAEQFRMPVLVSRPASFTPDCRMEFDEPIAWDEVARSFPSLRLVIGGLGFPWIDETLVLLAKHPGVHADLAGVASRPWQLFNALQTAMSLGVLDKLLFASGFPYETPARAIENLYSVNSFAHGTPLPAIPRSLLRSIVERDPMPLLGVEMQWLGGANPRSAKVGSVADAIRA